MNLEKILSIIDKIPESKTFLTVDELNESTKNLAEKYPDKVSVETIAVSRAGDEIPMLKIGNGKKNVLMFAMPHPNEPIGSMMLEFLCQELVENEELLNSYDYTWHIMKCIDVDGTRLNEGWFKGPFSLTNYAQNYYRPPSHQQVEWTFPIEYKRLKFDDPLPETKGLMNVIEDIKPDFIFSLHNSGFGGVYLYLSKDEKEFYPDFYKLVKSQDLPLHLGEPEVPYAQKFSDAVFGMINITHGYDFMEENGVDPLTTMKTGSSSYEYAQKFCNPFFLVCEMPYFYNPAIHDTSKTETIRRDAVMQSMKDRKEMFAFFKEEFAKIETELTLASPFYDAISTNLEMYEGHLAAQENWAKNAPELDEKATVAEEFDNILAGKFYGLLSVGMFVRMIEAQIAESGETETLKASLKTTRKYFEDWAKDLESAMEYEVVPIKKLVSVQLGCALLLMSRN